jgi:hypothetical protein
METDIMNEKGASKYIDYNNVDSINCTSKNWHQKELTTNFQPH